MPPDIAPLMALLGVGTFTLLGMRMWLKHKIERQRLAGSEDVDRMVDAIDRLHDQIQTMRDEMGELQERVDFAERLLARGEVQPGAEDR